MNEQIPVKKPVYAQATADIEGFDSLAELALVSARRAMLMSAFCYYQANKYTDAISTADQYIQLHPGSHEIAYAFYLKAMSLYEQITDVGRDQSNTEQALTALQDVVQRFPNTEYARDGHELGVEFLAENASGEVFARAGHSASAEWAIDMDTPIRRHFSPSTHHRGDDEVAIARIYALARANRLRLHQSRLTS